MLFQKYRPKTFGEIIGNASVIAALEGMLEHPEEMPHTFIFAGPSGCGKTTLARILAQKLGCTSDMVLMELNAANTRGIDTIRRVVEETHIRPWQGKFKMFIFDESHQLTSVAQEALLKETEDAMSYCFFIFCTTAPNNLIHTLRNRATMLVVEKLHWEDIYDYLVDVCEHERVSEKNVSGNILESIAKSSDGSMRRALVSLEVAIEAKSAKLAEELIKSGTEQDVSVIKLCEILLLAPERRKKDWKRALKVLYSIKEDSETIRRAVLGFLSNRVMIMERVEDAADVAFLLKLFSEDTYSGGLGKLVSLVIIACVGSE